MMQFRLDGSGVGIKQKMVKSIEFLGLQFIDMMQRVQHINKKKNLIDDVILASSIIIIILMLWPSKLKAQQLLKGRILDSTNNPVPYTSIQVDGESLGTVADVNGYFELEITQSLPIKLIAKNVAYQTKEIEINNIKETEFTFYLKHKTFTLNEITISGKNEVKYYGVPEKPKGILSFISFYPFQQLGLLFDDKRINSTVIKSVSFYVIDGFFYSNRPNGNSKMRLRIYSVDENGIPKEDLLNSEIIVAPNHGGWNTIELKEHQLVIDKTPIVVAIEWLEDNEFSEIKLKRKETYIHYGLAIKGHKVKKKDQYHFKNCYYNPYENNWKIELGTHMVGIRLEALQ